MGLFRKKKQNYAENLVLNSYVFGIVNLLSFMFIGIAFIFKKDGFYMGNFKSILTFGTLAYCYTRIFEGKWYWNLLKSFIMLLSFFFALLGLAFLLMFKMKLLDNAIVDF
jgi:hypothetical protein